VPSSRLACWPSVLCSIQVYNHDHSALCTSLSGSGILQPLYLLRSLQNKTNFTWRKDNWGWNYKNIRWKNKISLARYWWIFREYLMNVLQWTFLNERFAITQLLIHGLLQGFSNGAPGPLWGPRSGSLRATSGGLHSLVLSLYCITQVSRYSKYSLVKHKFVVFIMTS